jgi:aspartokinase/homoserine dehydrogenase 1
MKVLKFGGTSVANAQNILLVEKIVKNVASDNKAVVVVSALSGVTDGLISAAELASAKNEKYTETIKSLEEKHLEFVKNLLPITEQSSWLRLCEEKF